MDERDISADDLAVMEAQRLQIADLKAQLRDVLQELEYVQPRIEYLRGIVVGLAIGSGNGHRLKDIEQMDPYS